MEKTPKIYLLKQPSCLSGFNTRLEMKSLQGFCIVLEIKVPG